ncbi:MAG: chemotaxis protein CheA [Deltaproteobacteria bacterium]|nr:chemotaxis protein CheA [Deltaproteobacteria bacterium]
MDEVDEILVEFLSESRDMIEDSVPRLIELQETSESTGDIDIEVLNAIFRTFHSIKGTAGFLEFNNINHATHTAENLMDLYRKGKKTISAHGISLLLKACDFMQSALDIIETEGNDLSLGEDAKYLIDELTVLIESDDDNSPADDSLDMSDASVSADSIEGEGWPEDGDESDVNEDILEAKTDTSEENISEESESEKQESMPADDSLDFDVSSEMKDRFIEEADDIIELSEGYLLSMEKDPSVTSELIPELFRQIHSFKGNCGFMGYADMEKVSHSMESQLNRFRDECDGNCGESVREASIKIFLEVVDVLRTAVADISKDGKGEISNKDEICEMVNGIGKMDFKGGNAKETKEVKDAPPVQISKPVKPQQAEVKAKETKKDAVVSKGIKSEKEDDSSDDKTKNQIEKKAPAKVMRRDIRVDLEKLDTLINLVGELVIAQAMVTNNPDVKGLDLENFDKASNHLDRIVRDLQDVAMSVRMIPIAGSFRKMIRLVHDLSRKFGKKVKLDLLGEDTEIDKTVAELIADPLVHIIRNAVDHGLESTADRIAKKKSEIGTIKLEARHEGGEIWILIQDDGQGLSRDVLIKKGIEKGLVEGDGSHMSDEQVYRLLFEPGFSTAPKVTDVSGRGVGMDVVRKNIEKLKGQIDITTTLGKGTSFILKIPLTLAIIEGMLVRVGQAKYTIPMLSIRGCIRAAEGTITTPMENHEIIKLREQLLPIVRLYSLHNVSPDSSDLNDGAMVIVEDREQSAAIFVDEILGQHQTVIKGLSNYMGNVQSVSGCTIMGDGDVSLILDPAGLIALAKDHPSVMGY